MAHPPPRLDAVLSFSLDHAAADAEEEEPRRPAPGDGADAAVASYDDQDEDAASASSDGEGFDFEFAFAPPLAGSHDGGDLAPADHLFAHGRILPAYPVFDRRLLRRDGDDDGDAPPQPAPEPDTYCAWAPRSAPGSPARDPGPIPKSASTGDARRLWRVRDLVGAGAGRSHSDGKDKFVFLHSPAAAAAPSKVSAKAAGDDAPAGKKKPSAAQQGQSKTTKGGKAAAPVTEMDMATAHKLFYSKQGGSGHGADRRQQQQSYLPYRPGIVGFFTAAHALGRSHHPY